MEEIIKKAIDGGYLNIENGSWEFKDEGLRTFRPKDDAFISYRSKYELILDPRFWQALGKAMGWTETERIKVWKFNAHEFHDINLTEGWDKAVEFLSSQLKQ